MHMCKSEFIQTAFMAVLAAIEHEARELFKYKGQSVLGPHFDLDIVHQLCVEGAEQHRDEPTEG